MPIFSRLVVALGLSVAIGSVANAETKIGIVVETLGNPYFACVKQSAETEAAKHDDVRLTVLGAATGTDLIGMTQMIDDLMQMKVDVIAFSAVDPNAMIQTARRIQDAGIKVLIHSDDLSEQVASHFVGPNQYEGQAAVTRSLAAAIDGRGKVAIIEGVPGNMSGTLRKKGAEDALAAYPDITVVGTWSADWDRAKGMQTAEDILTAHPDLAGIVAVNDEMAFGALQAVQARNFDRKIPIVGFNGVKEAIQSVHRGELHATVLTFCDAVGRELILTGKAIVAGDDDDKPYTIDTGTFPLDTKLVRAVADALGLAQ